jgi:subtilisin family serine protease
MAHLSSRAVLAAAVTSTVLAATRAVPVHDGEYDVTGDGVGDAYEGSGFSVAVIDSGVDGTHPMFQGPRRLRGQEEHEGHVRGRPGNPHRGPQSHRRLRRRRQLVNDTDTAGGGGHGTHVSGIAAGYRVTDAAGRHLRGAAPGADLVVLSAASVITVYGGMTAMNWILTHHADPCGDGSCPLVIALNSSWSSGQGHFEATNPFVVVQRRLVSEGVTMVWSAGNDGGTGSNDYVNLASQDPTPGILSIANYDDGGVGSRDNVLDNASSRGVAGRPSTYPDLAAPGAYITSACRQWLAICHGVDEPDPDYGRISGTSMAAPHITGYIAVLGQAALETTGTC